MNYRNALTLTLLCLFFSSSFAQSIQSVNPDTVYRNQVLNMTITGQGTNFYQATQATQATTTSWLVRGIDVILPVVDIVQSPTVLTSVYSIPSNAALGYWDVYVSELSGILILQNGVFVDDIIGNDPIGPSIKESISVFPNPVVDRFTIEYSLPRFADVEVLIMDMRGRHVKSLLSQHQSPGSYKEQFNLYGQPLANEPFLVVLRVDDMAFATRMTVIR